MWDEADASCNRRMGTLPANASHPPIIGERRMSAHETPWRAQIWQHSGLSDTVCIKDAQGREIVSWAGFDGVPGTKAEIRARARLIVKAVNALTRNPSA